ncbi:calcium/calmodulin-dependent protein kinase kinase 2-like [Oscarella lobularis]|uniref:calcium/calmodulin-dependent protein kinase kinase 2-like n=1 Tax=Oscarella lobularis TaxID=121494 RepID=UPI003313AE5D
MDAKNGDPLTNSSPGERRTRSEEKSSRTPKLGQIPRSTRVTKTPPGDDPFDASSSSDHRLLLPDGGGGGGEERRSSWSPGDRSSSPRLPYQKSGSFRRQTTIETQHVMLQENDEGTKLNQYIIRDEIGMGSYGVVCSATDDRDQKYAVKMISKKKLKKATFGQRRPPRGPMKEAPPTAVQLLQREIAILKKIRHPNVVHLIEVLDDETHDYLYLVFELLERGPVMDVPTKETFSEEQARHYVIDILLGIEYLHFHKIIHRDIKPDNLLLTKDDHIKIADFGVSELFDASDANLTKSAGSPSFMAPEALMQTSSRVPFRGKATDVWALGVTLFCFIYGNCPFRSLNVMELYELIKTQPVQFPDDCSISEDLRDLFDRIFDKDPTKRITVPEMKMHPWVTLHGQDTLPSAEENCKLVEVTEEDVANATKDFASFPVLVILKSMARRKSLRHPFLSMSSSTKSKSKSASEAEED